MKPRIVILLALLALSGCLRDTAKRAAPSGSVPAALSEGFTGALIFTDPAICLPCRYLDGDLQWLVRNYPAWSYGEFSRGQFDWSTSSDLQAVGTIPTIVFYLNGVEVGRQEGYSTDPNPNVRKDILAELVARHPLQETYANQPATRPAR